MDVSCPMGFSGLQYMPDCSQEALINAMDNFWITMACVSHNAALLPDIKII
jgi:hypothetical protein